jgi:hypothetical protein
MRQKAATAVFTALAWMLVYPAPSPAKPTRSLARSTMRNQIADRPAFHDRPSLHSAAAAQHLSHSDLRMESRRETSEAPRLVAVAAHTSRTPRFHASELDHLPAPKRDRWRSSPKAAESAVHYSFPALHTIEPSRPPADGAATGDEPVDGNRSTLTNVGGILRSDLRTDTQSKSSAEEASVSALLRPLYDLRGRLVVPPPLYGSHDILVHQNQMADREGLERVRDDADLVDLRRARQLVALPENNTIRIDQRLPENRRFARPSVAAFLSVLAADFYASFHLPLQIDSAVRTVEFQQRLIRSNGNAAPAEGDTASPHLTGQAVDIAKRGLSLAQVAWLRVYLQPLIEQGKIDVEEEFQQACFHISVYQSYLPASVPHVSVAAASSLPSEPLR